MRYMGGKAKIARRLVAAILADTARRDVWFEPFVGGGNVLEHAAPHFSRSIAADAHPDLIMMWRAVQDGYVPPSAISREEWYALKASDPSALRGFAGFGSSFGGRWFGGYVGDYTHASRRGTVTEFAHRAVLRQAAVFRAHDVTFKNAAFGELTPETGSVVYCDPPYEGTKKYSSLPPFDHALFFKTVAEWADAGCDVYVSGYTVPDSIRTEVVWTTSKRVSITKDDPSKRATEILFKVGGTHT